MEILIKEDKKDLIEDAKSTTRREDFRKLSKTRHRGFSLEWLEEITRLIPTSYPKHLIKADKNRL
ncbi:hypothetical protein KAW65_04670 [candidate division WOR-3 bacterium]|nr:hypothetical protein [candidate division WOR-3 bacterium]